MRIVLQFHILATLVRDVRHYPHPPLLEARSCSHRYCLCDCYYTCHYRRYSLPVRMVLLLLPLPEMHCFAHPCTKDVRGRPVLLGCRACSLNSCRGSLGREPTWRVLFVHSTMSTVHSMGFRIPDEGSVSVQGLGCRLLGVRPASQDGIFSALNPYSLGPLLSFI